jgi:hypothetical protein
MNFLKTTYITGLVLSSLMAFAPHVFAAAPDGLGPWADTVFSSNQGLQKNGQPVATVRSDPTAALGVAENTPLVDSTFYSLGFGGNIVLGFDNGISTGAMVVEATIEPGYPDETAKVEMSEDGTTWVMAGNVVQGGAVNIPETLTCAKYVRITDTSDASIMPDDVADGYDVDGVKATGDPCTPTTPTPTIGLTPTLTPTPTQGQSGGNDGGGNGNGDGGNGGGGTGGSSSNTTCTAVAITTVPAINLARRTSPTSIFVSWGPNTGLSNFIVQYGFQNGNWQFSTKVSGFSTTIDNLPANQAIWIEVAATDNCSIGSYGGAVLIGGTAATNTPGFPNTGTPCTPSGNPLIPCFPNTGLPNTGMGPNENKASWFNQSPIQNALNIVLNIYSNNYNSYESL